METEVILHFRDQLRTARALASRDAEAFEEIIFVLERFGEFLSGKKKGLGKFLKAIQAEAAQSPMAEEVPEALPDFHQRFDVKYDLVREGRNSAVHEGASARHLTMNAIELSLILEEAIMSGRRRVSDFMVRSPVCTSLWQPLSFIRQTMLCNSFSYLPVPLKTGDGTSWQLISDLQLARHLRRNGTVEKTSLTQRLGDAVESGNVKLHPADICQPQESIEVLLSRSNGMPALIVSPNDNELLGILTPFDLL